MVKIFTLICFVCIFLSSKAIASISTEYEEPWIKISDVRCKNLTMTRFQRGFSRAIESRLDYKFDNILRLSVYSEAGYELNEAPLYVRVYLADKTLSYYEVGYEDYIHVTAVVIKRFSGPSVSELAKCANDY